MQKSALVSRRRKWDLGNLRLVLPMLVAAFLVLGGCTMNETEQRTVSGAGIGAAGGAAMGAIIGAFTGTPGVGAAIGAAAGTAVGAGAGYIVDQRDKREQAQAQNRRLEQENRQLQQQNKQLQQQNQY